VRGLGPARRAAATETETPGQTTVPFGGVASGRSRRRSAPTWRTASGGASQKYATGTEGARARFRPVSGPRGGSRCHGRRGAERAGAGVQPGARPGGPEPFRRVRSSCVQEPRCR
jgi:hypothetical protein